MNRFITPVKAWKAFNYRCEVCGKEFKIYLQVGVEGPADQNEMPSPFSLSCPNECKGFFPLMHVDWWRDEDVWPIRNAKKGDYIFVLDKETGCGTPVEIMNDVLWTAKMSFLMTPRPKIDLMSCQVDEDKYRHRIEEESRREEVLKMLREGLNR